jgi:glycosyltransferase involved in cell wall biosynthesis
VRIVHVAPTPFGAGGLLGGGERYPVELARALARHVDVDLVTFGSRPGIAHDRSGLRVRTLRPVGHGHRHPVHPIAPQLLWSLDGADVVHTHHTRSAPSRVAAVAARLRGQRLVTTDHGLGGGGWLGVLPALFDRFLTVSRFSASVLGVPAHKTRVVYGGADPQRFAPDPDLSREGVLFLGRLTPHKGIDRLIRALPDGARLTVAGTGGHDARPPERDYPLLLRELARGRDVAFPGAVSDADLPMLHRGAAVFVLPTVKDDCYGRHFAISELLGLSVLEAMASGTPVVASRVDGLPEVVHDGETGFLVTPGNVDELRDRVAQLLADRALAARMGRRGRELLLEQFTWEACAQRCLAAYEELLAPGTHGVCPYSKS